jgi:hypothetical protein
MTSRARRVLAAFLLVFASVAPLAAAAKGPPKPDPRAWPSVYEPVELTAADALAKQRAAVGTAATGRDSSRVTIRVRTNGLEGTQHIARRGYDYLDASTLGPFRTIEGRRNGRKWAQNENGYVRMFHGVHIRPQADVVEAGTSDDEGEAIHVLGRLRSPADVYVLGRGPVANPTGRYFLDPATFRVVREEYQELGRLAVVSYEDYRTTDGMVYPWHVTTSDGRPANDVTNDVVKFEAGPVVEDYELAMSAQGRSPVVLPFDVDSVRIPARFIRSTIVMRMDVNGRGLDFELDSGADGVLIDDGVAAQLKLAHYGHRADMTAGPYTSSQVVLPHATVGGVTITDLVATAAPFRSDQDRDTTIVGLLGYDFIAGFVLRIDYEHQTVDAIRSSAFTIPPNAQVLDAALDDGIPVLSMDVNGVTGKHFILDTGAAGYMIFPNFADAHKDAVKDDSKDKLISRYFDFVVGSGVGGRLYMHAILVKDTFFGNVHYPNFIALVLNHGQEAFAGEDFDGLIGAPLLRAFVVYLDYAHERVVLVPNSSVKIPGTPSK